MVSFYQADRSPVRAFRNWVLRPFQRQSYQTQPALRMAVVDNFTRKQVDVDGDMEPDLSHGDMVKIIYKALSPRNDLVDFPLRGPDNMNSEIKTQLKMILDRIRNGEHFDGVNMSLSSNAWFPHFRVEEGWDGKTRVNYQPSSQQSGADGGGKGSVAMRASSLSIAFSIPPKKTYPLTRENMLEHLSALRECIGKDKILKTYVITEILELIEQIVQNNVPVFVAAGNVGIDNPAVDPNKRLAGFNYLSLARGAIVVGATNTQGVDAPYSFDNPLVNTKAQGTYSVTKVPGGYDINGDGQADVLDIQVSGQRNKSNLWYSNLGDFAKQKAWPHVASPADMEIMQTALQDSYSKQSLRHIIRERLFPLEAVRKMGWISEPLFDYLKPMGDYVVLNPLFYLMRAQDPRRVQGVTRVSSKGKVYYSPDGSTRDGVVNVLTGTSFALPNAAWEILSSRKQEQGRLRKSA